MPQQTSGKLHKVSNPGVQSFSDPIEEKSLGFFSGFESPESPEFFFKDISYEEIAIDLEKLLEFFFGRDGKLFLSSKKQESSPFNNLSHRACEVVVLLGTQSIQHPGII